MLIETYAGAFPTWLAPTQVKVLPLAEKHFDYAKGVVQTLRDSGVRVELDDRNEKVGYKIREAQMQKVPYMLVIGDKELEAKQVAVRGRKDGDLGAIAVDEFVHNIVEEIRTRAL